jgi:Protein of unknown function (DUF2721)
MNLEMIARTIQFILAPAVVVNACAVMMGGLLAHYAAINDRLRALNRERLERLKNPDDPITLERLNEIDMQTPTLLKRHRLARNAVFSIYLAISVFVISMFVIAVAVVLEAVWVSTLALIVFLSGALLLLLGLGFITLEILGSHHTIEFEVRRVSSLKTTATPLARSH